MSGGFDNDSSSEVSYGAGSDQGFPVSYSQDELLVLTDSTDGGALLRGRVGEHPEDSRVRVGGFISRLLGTRHAMVPALSQDKVDEVVAHAAEPREDLLENLLRAHPDRQWAREFSRDKCVIPLRPGIHTTAVRMPGLTDVSIYEYDDEEEPECVPFTDKKKYTLDQFFADQDVIEKFPFTQRFLQTARRCAVAKPWAAAEMVEKHLRNRGYTGVTVRAGKYIQSKAKAASAIRFAAEKLIERDLGVWSQTVKDRIFYYHDLDSEVSWTVEGPLAYAFEVKCIYDLCMAVGIEEAVQTLSWETAKLEIVVFDGVTGQCVSGLIEAHVNMDGITPLEEQPHMGLSAAEFVSFRAMTDRVLPVQVAGRTVASAVRVTEKYVLMCDHVLRDVQEQDAVTVADCATVPHKMVGNDLWVVGCPGGLQSAWSMREAHVGERVVLIYSVGDALEVSNPVAVSNVDGSDIALTVPPQLRKGMSGAAVAAVSDMALLGVYRARAGDKAVATVFGAHKYEELVDLELTSQASIGGQHDADDVAQRYERKGFAPAFRAACEAVVPLHTGKVFAGFGLCYNADLVTPLDPDVYPLRLGGKSGRAPEFNLTGDGRYYCSVERSEARGVYTQSRPQVGGRVVVCGKDADGVYLSEVCVVNQIGVGAKRFYIDPPEHSSSMPLVGGVVLSYDNATVLGQYLGKDMAATGTKGVCMSTYEPGPDNAQVQSSSLESALAAKFPMLTPIAWEPGVLRKLVHHPKGAALMEKRAMVGDAIMRVAGCQRLEKMGARGSTWSAMLSQFQNGEALTRAAVRHGLKDVFRLAQGPQVVLNLEKLVGALVGLAFLHESWAVVVRFCDYLGVVPHSADESITPTVSTFQASARARSSSTNTVESISARSARGEGSSDLASP